MYVSVDSECGMWANNIFDVLITLNPKIVIQSQEKLSITINYRRYSFIYSFIFCVGYRQDPRAAIARVSNRRWAAHRVLVKQEEKV